MSNIRRILEPEAAVSLIAVLESMERHQPYNPADHARSRAEAQLHMECKRDGISDPGLIARRFDPNEKA